MINKPTMTPNIVKKAGRLLRYIRIDCGNISPNTTYSIAPLAKPRLMASPKSPISPNQYPNNAPIIVGAPLKVISLCQVDTQNN